MTIALPPIHIDDIEQFGNNVDEWIKVAKNTYVCIEYRAVLVDDWEYTEVRPLTTKDVARWNLWDWYGPEDYDDDGDLITEFGESK